MNFLLFISLPIVSWSTVEPPLDDAWMYTNSDTLVSINSLAFASKRRFLCPLIDFTWSWRHEPIEVQFLHELVPPVLYIVRPSGDTLNIQLHSRELLREATCGDIANGLARARSVGGFETVVFDFMKLRIGLYDEWIQSVFTKTELSHSVIARSLSEIHNPIHVPHVTMDRMVMMVERSLLSSFACIQLITSDGSFHVSTRISNKFLAVDVFDARNVASSSSVSFYLGLEAIKTSNLVCGDLLYSLNRIRDRLTSAGLVSMSAEVLREKLVGTRAQAITRRLACPDVALPDGRLIFTSQHLSLMCGPDSEGWVGLHIRFGAHPQCVSTVDTWETNARCVELVSIKQQFLKGVFDSRATRLTDTEAWPRAILNI